MNKISFEKWRNFRAEYYGNPNHLRLGQAFINKFYPNSGNSTSYLYYEVDNQYAERLILQNFVEGG